MSAEGKKKRGLSGQANAKTVPFRYGGKPCNYSVTIGHPAWSPRGAGSKLVQAMALGVRLSGFNPSQQLLNKTDAAMARCTHPALAADDEPVGYARAAE
jgi:hypothetical protein